jgi:hypothetical protein
MPAAARGQEAIWITIAKLVAEALFDLTGQKPGQSVGIVGSEHEGRDGGWGLELFQAFARAVVAALPEDEQPPESGDLSKPWRRAHERLTAAGFWPKGRSVTDR